MNFRSPERIIALTLFTAAAAMYGVTSYPSVGLRNSGELVTAAHTLGVHHAPGYGLYLLVLKVGSLVPVAADIARRMNIVSALLSAASVSLAYLLTMRLITQTLREDRHTEMHAMLAHCGGVIGALTLAFSDSFWANANQSETANPAVLLTLGIVWGVLRWHDGSGNAVFLLAYLFGFATGVNWFVLALVIPTLMTILLRQYAPTKVTIVISTMISIIVFLLLFAGVASWGPSLVAWIAPKASASSLLASMLIVALLACLVLVSVRFVPLPVAQFAMIATLFLVGASTSLVIPVRATRNPAVNAGAPITVSEYRDYQSAGAFSAPAGIVDRRWNRSENTEHVYSRFDSDVAFFFFYQLQETFMRYFFWNFVGRSSDRLLADPALPGVDQRLFGPDERGQNPSFPKQYYAIPFVLGFVGLFRQLRTAPAAGFVLLLSFLLLAMIPVIVLNTPIIQGPEFDGIFVPSFALFSLLVGVGAATFARWWRGAAHRHAGPAFALVLLFVLIPFNLMRLNAADHHHGQDYSTPDFAYNLLQSCDSNAVLITEGNDDTFPLLYLQHASEIRKDIRIINRTLLNTAWYSDQCLRPANGGLAGPVVTRLTEADIQRLAEPGPYSLLETGWLTDQKEIQIAVPKHIMKRFASERPRRPKQAMDTTMRDAQPTAMVYYARAEYPVALDSSGETIRYYRPWREVMLENIIRSANWKRPVYFSVTCDRDALNGLEDFLRLEGLAWRVTPLACSDEPYLLLDPVMKHLFTPTTEMSAQRRRGFLHRSRFEEGAYIDPVTMGYCINHRNVSLRCAEYLQRFHNDTAGVVRTLQHMNAQFPRAVYPMDYRYLYDIALLYRAAGESRTWSTLRNIVIAECRADIRREPGAVFLVHSPYRFLLDIYQLGKEHQKALNVLDEMQRHAPLANDIRAKRQEILDEIQHTNPQ